MKIYIASSWKNQHAVQMLTALLREKGHEVISFIENNFKEEYNQRDKFDFDKWMETDNARRSFVFDCNGAMTSDLVIYISPSGQDAAAEVGMAYASGIPIIGLYAKGEGFGLMRKMMDEWEGVYSDVLDSVDSYNIKFQQSGSINRKHSKQAMDVAISRLKNRISEWEKQDYSYLQPDTETIKHNEIIRKDVVKELQTTIDILNGRP